ncbi:ABC transporter ATP-binding protein/permease [Candidatus Saccharibacteria bacterium]|nr:ABC transporter ATP-binding protein/permease [Candidatus Saccharibacteria bacterium]MCL1962724.1 ABC transporter ATP-binding protein/permease [Candidatus Saccharibacteria bacterium]
MSDTTDDLKKIQAKKTGGHFNGHPPGTAPGEKPKQLGKSIKQLIKYMKCYIWQLIFVVIFAVASTVFAIASPKVLGNMTTHIVDDYVKAQVYDQVTKNLPDGMVIQPGTTLGDLQDKIKLVSKEQSDKMSEAMSKMSQKQQDELKKMDLSIKPEMDWSILGTTAMWLIGLYLLSMAFGYIQGWIISGVTTKVTFRFRRDISEKINRLPLKYFDTRAFGDVLSRITNDVDTISQSLSQSLSQLITSITTIIGIIIMMLSISWQMTGIAVVTIPLSLLFIAIIVKHSQKYFKKQQDHLGSINGHVEEIYAGHNIVKVFAGEKRAIKTFKKYNKELYHSGWKSQFLSGLMFPTMNFIGNLGYVAVAVMGGWLAINGRISIGDIQAFIQYVQQFNQPIIQAANVANVIQSTAAAAERVFEFLGEEEESRDPKDAVTLENIRGDVEFSHVKFGYDKDKTVIKDFSAKVKAGQTVAIVGPTGAGKTTLVNLLMRFYDPWSGSIKIDGVDTMTMRRADVRKNFAMVLQDTWLFHGTVRENLAYGDLNATDKEIENAAKAAHVSHFIHALPGGYDTILEEDAENISSGEKQLLTIARAMLADAPMLILDEATSNVDTRTEVLIQKAMHELMKGKTSFVIAHRLSTIRDADLILVINEGDIVEHGTHKQMIKNNGFYAKLYNSQFTEE